MLSQFKGRPVLVTGATGFKGGWLTASLLIAGAKVMTVSLPPNPGQRMLWRFVSGLGGSHFFTDLTQIRDLYPIISSHNPLSIFHLAAQPLVKDAYNDPYVTYSSNVLGTVALLDLVRSLSHTPRTFINVTTDKVFKVSDSNSPFAEGAELGGSEPYSQSKVFSEMVTQCFKETYEDSFKHVGLALARAGNVIGGGDFSKDRIIPDFFRALDSSDTLLIRNPRAIRPWQHVYDVIRAYLKLDLYLRDNLSGSILRANISPLESSQVTVEELLLRLANYEPGAKWRIEQSAIPETGVLRLASAETGKLIGWHPTISLNDALLMTVEWHRLRGDTGALYRRCECDIYERIFDA